MRKVSFSAHKFYRLFAAGTTSLFVCIIAESIDNIVAGNMINEEAISAVGIVSSIYTLICCISVLIGSGGAIIYQQLIGKFEKENAKVAICTALISSLVLGLLLAFCFAIFEDNLLELFGCSEELLSYAHQYYSFYILIAFLYPVYNLIYNLVYNDGDALCAAFGDCAQLISNIILSIVFCKFFGLEGISFATCIALLLSTLVCCTHFFKRKNSIRIKFGFNFSYLINFIRYSLGEATVFLSSAILIFVANVFIIDQFGEYYLPVLNVGMFIVSIIGVCDGIAKAVTPFICIYYSENNKQGIKHIMKTACSTCLFTGLLITVLFFCLSDLIPVWYGVSSEDLIAMSSVLVKSISAFAVIIALLFVFSQYYLIIGKITLAVSMMIVTSIVSPIICLIVPGVCISIDAMWIIYGAHPILSLIICSLILLIKYGRRNFPLLIADNKTISQNFNLLLNRDNLINTQKELIKFLEENHIDKNTINKISLYVEEIGIRVLDENKSKKIIMEYSIIINDNNLKLIARDDGKVFNITDQDCKAVSLNTFVMSTMLKHSKSNTYIKSTGFNRSVYEFDL